MQKNMELHIFKQIEKIKFDYVISEKTTFLIKKQI